MRHNLFSVMGNFCNPKRDERGAVTVEMALVTLVLSGILFGLFEIARYGMMRYHLDRATYYAARYLTLNPNQLDAARAMINVQVARNVGGRVDAIQLDVTNVRRDGQCLLVVSARTSYRLSELDWLIPVPNLESVQVLPQTNECEQFVTPYPIASGTPTPIPTVTVARALPALLDEAEGVALVNANIRLGPGFEYAIVGRLNEREVVKVRGRDETGTWLQIVPERIGWVYAPLVQMDAAVSSLKIVAAPPLPARTPLPPTLLHFDASPKKLRVGECALLRWDARDATFVTLNEETVALKGERRVCPTSSVKYVLSVGYAGDKFFDRQVEIAVQQ